MLKMSEPGPKRHRLTFSNVPVRIRAITPKAHDLKLARGPPTPTAPPNDVATKLGKRCLVAGIDVETHDWEERACKKGDFGQYGFYSICHPDDLNARIVQLGWAVGRTQDELVVKEHIVYPSDFVISERAAQYHGISHDIAMRHGRPLQEVLAEFMNDMIQVYRQGGRIVVHHLEFDCGIIGRELQRSGLELTDIWRCIAQEGVCTMDPYIGRWIRMCCGEDVWPGSSKNTLRLKDMVALIAPHSAQLLSSAHTAGADAQLHAAVYFACMHLAGGE